ncbi:hypothetical protein HED49_10180 [Ochrobactrum daejeonense]|nr:hypothetical protein [Brucella daejeonensis]
MAKRGKAGDFGFHVDVRAGSVPIVGDLFDAAGLGQKPVIKTRLNFPNRPPAAIAVSCLPRLREMAGRYGSARSLVAKRIACFSKNRGIKSLRASNLNPAKVVENHSRLAKSQLEDFAGFARQIAV